jgi:hypothetical protein
MITLSIRCPELNLAQWAGHSAAASNVSKLATIHAGSSTSDCDETEQT